MTTLAQTSRTPRMRLPRPLSWFKRGPGEGPDGGSKRAMSLTDHLGELRKRIIVSAVAVAVMSVAGYLLADPILVLLRQPVDSLGMLVFTSLGEAFGAVLRIAITFGLVTAFPLILFEFWRFVAPGLSPSERRLVGLMVPVAVLLFMAGMAFAFFLMLPVSVRFFLSFGGTTLKPMLTLSSYLSFVLSLLFAFGLTFEVPVVLYVLIRLGILKRQTLIRQRKVAILAIIVFAAVVTPTVDAISMALLALPLWGLFELTLLATAGVRNG